MKKATNSLESSHEYGSIHNALAVIGDRWTLCVLSEAFYGVHRFDEMREHLGVASNILSHRLAHLVKHAILEQVPYKEAGRRMRYEYHLTSKGRALLPALVALIEWGDQHMPDPSIEAASIVHVDCNQEVHVKLLCTNGHEIDNFSQLKRIVRASSPPQSNESQHLPEQN